MVWHRYPAGHCYENLQSCMTFLSLVDGQCSLHYLEMFFLMYTLDFYMNSSVYPEIYLCQKYTWDGQGHIWKIIALMAMLTLFTDVSHSLTFKAWGMGMDQGRETHWEEEILFLPPESNRGAFLISKLQWKGFHWCNSENMQHTLNVCILQVCTTALLINMIIIKL